MRLNETQSEHQGSIRLHIRLLGHNGYGVTELRIFEPQPMVAYADNEEDVIRLSSQMDGQVPGIYVGAQPRPLDQFDKAPNCWRAARSAPKSNCACDRDIEYITVCFFDIDVVSEARAQGHPASEEELLRSYNAARLLSQEDGFALNSTICCSGNGNYVLTPIVPISIYDAEAATKFRYFCQQVADRIAAQVKGAKIDPVYNLSRVMRLMDTVNRKGQVTPGRPHRRAHFVTQPIPAKSMALHYMILNTDITSPVRESNTPSGKIKCDLSKIEQCEFIQWCRLHATEVTEPQWFAMITNLAHMEDGPKLIHEISRLDMFRYDHQQTQRLIERVRNRGYSPANCKTIRNNGFYCPKFGQCQVKAPMYLTRLFSI